MTTAETEAVVAQPVRQKMYASRRSALRLTKRKRYPQRNPITGELHGVTQGEYVPFRDGVFTCPTEGMVLLRDSLDGGESEVEASELIAYLERHPLFNDRFEGFWEITQTAPPISPEELRELMRLAQTFDKEALEKVIETERVGWNREGIITAAEDNIAGIERMEREAEAKAKGAK